MRAYRKKGRPRQAEKMGIMKELLIKRREEGLSIRKIAIEYDVNEGTLGDWLFYWKNGFKRRPEEYKKKNPKEPGKYKRRFSQELQERIKRNTEENNKRIKYMNRNENTMKIGIK